jgi:hypothetical protein
VHSSPDDLSSAAHSSPQWTLGGRGVFSAGEAVSLAGGTARCDRRAGSLAGAPVTLLVRRTSGRRWAEGRRWTASRTWPATVANRPARLGRGPRLPGCPGDPTARPPRGIMTAHGTPQPRSPSRRTPRQCRCRVPPTRPRNRMARHRWPGPVRGQAPIPARGPGPVPGWVPSPARGRLGPGQMLLPGHRRPARRSPPAPNRTVRPGVSRRRSRRPSAVPPNRRTMPRGQRLPAERTSDDPVPSRPPPRVSGRPPWPRRPRPVCRSGRIISPACRCRRFRRDTGNRKGGRRRNRRRGRVREPSRIRPRSG